MNKKGTAFTFAVMFLISGCKVGLSLCWSDNNVIYHNNFVHNQQQVSSGLKPIWTGSSEEKYSVCQWDNGTEGNYWEDYPTGKGANDNDAFHTIDENNTDRYPLTEKYPTPAFAFPSSEPSFPFPSPTSAPTGITPTESSIIPIGGTIAVFACVTIAVVGLYVFSKKHKQWRVSR